MTVLVGIYCKNGIVIGADSAATSSATQLPTAKSPTRKISIIKDKVIVTTTGSVGLSQRFRELVGQLFDQDLFSFDATKSSQDGKPEKTAIMIAETISRDAINRFRSTGIEKINLGALMAFPYRGGHYLFEFEYGNMQPEMKEKELWHVSMGIGQPIADPFLCFMANIYCADRKPPNLSQGTFIATWALDHTIKVAPQMVDDPVRLAVISKDKNGKLMAADFPPDEHQTQVGLLNEHIRAFPGDTREISGEKEVPEKF